jgi:hypothetical protein
MISQSAFAAGAGAAEVGAGAAEVGAGVAEVGAGVVAAGAGAADEADGQGVDVADSAGTGIVVELPAEADGSAARPSVPATAGVAEALPSVPAGVAPTAAGEATDLADVADPAETGVRQGFARAAALAEASSAVLMCGVMTAAIPTPSTSARSPVISAGRARSGRFSWLR